MKNKSNSSLNANRQIYDAVRKMALHGIIDPKTGSTYTAGRKIGYVKKINDDESDEALFGTIDVKEFNTLTEGSEEDELIGYHKGVHLSVIQHAETGMVIIPKVGSEVMIAQDALTLTEYVVMYSHVDVIKLDAFEQVSIGVTEREEYDPEDGDAPDIEELKLTGVRAITNYTKDSIESEVVDEEGSKVVKTGIYADSLGFDVAEGETIFTADKDQVELIRDDVTQTFKSGEAKTDVGGEYIKITPQGIAIGDTKKHAVLGEALADILADMCDGISQIMTPTMMGPQPPANQMAKFISLSAQIKAWKGALTNFISSKVTIQE